MIQEVVMYTVICDGCGVDAFDDDDYNCWPDKVLAKDQAMEADWIQKGGKHYCPDCFSYDDNDNLVLKTNKQ